MGKEVRILLLRVTNFLPFVGTQEINFSDLKTVVVSGPNGTGKSSLFIDAPLFALFGKARKRPEELINDSSEEMEVALTFEHGGQIFTVTRGIKKGKIQTLKLEQQTFETPSSITGKQKLSSVKSLTERLLTNTQKKLEDILGFSYDLLLSTAIAQQDEINKLSNLTPAQREQIITEMLALGIWEQKKKRVQELLLDLKKHEEEIDSLELESEVARGSVTKISDELTQTNSSLNPLVTSREHAQNELERTEQQFREREKYGYLQTEVANLTTKITSDQQRLSKIETHEDPQKIRDLLEKCDIDAKEYTTLVTEVESMIPSLREQFTDILTKKLAAENFRGTQDSTKLLSQVPCKGLDIHHQCLLLKDAHAAKGRLGTFLTGISRLAPSIEEYLKLLQKKEEKLSTDLNSLDTNLKQLRKREQENFLFKNKLSQTLKECEEGNKLQSAIHNNQLLLHQKQCELDALPKVNTDELISLRQQVTALDQQINQLKITLAQRKTQLDGYQKRIGEIETRLTELNEIRKKVADYRTLLQAYTDIPTLLFTEVIPQIESYANEILVKISPDKRIQLRAYRDTKAGTQVKALDVIGTTPTGVREFDNLSGSEKFRQSLALRIALSKVNSELYNTQIGFFIVDEGLGSLDLINLALMKAALRHAASNFDLFIIITHVPEFEDVFDTRILVNGKSQIQIIEQKPSSEVSLDV